MLNTRRLEKPLLLNYLESFSREPFYDGAPSVSNQSDFPRLAGGTIPFIRKYSTICP